MLVIQPKDKKYILYISVINNCDICAFKLSPNFVLSVKESQLVICYTEVLCNYTKHDMKKIIPTSENFIFLTQTQSL